MLTHRHAISGKRLRVLNDGPRRHFVDHFGGDRIHRCLCQILCQPIELPDPFGVHRIVQHPNLLLRNIAQPNVSSRVEGRSSNVNRQQPYLWSIILLQRV